MLLLSLPSSPSIHCYDRVRTQLRAFFQESLPLSPKVLLRWFQREREKREKERERREKEREKDVENCYGVLSSNSRRGSREADS